MFSQFQIAVDRISLNQELSKMETRVSLLAIIIKIKGRITLILLCIALYPFHASENTYYTANTARHTRTFGYTYPEVEDWGVSKADLETNVRRHVNELYNNPTSQPKKRTTVHRRALRSDGYTHANNKSQSNGISGTRLETLLDSTFDIVEAIGDSISQSLEMFDEWGVNNMKKQWVVKIKVNK